MLALLTVYTAKINKDRTWFGNLCDKKMNVNSKTGHNKSSIYKRRK